jgi:hypothetical protein
MRRHAFFAAGMALSVGVAVTLGFASDLSRIGRAFSHGELSRAVRDPREDAEVGGGYCRFPPRTEATTAKVGHRTSDTEPDSTALLLLQGQSSAVGTTVRKDSLCTGVSPAAQGFRTVDR